MLSALIILVIGIIIGWNWPQPPWARDAQNKVVAWIRSLLSK
ncbi:hypothetical protein Thimo_1258 [Thioflavicoccus mobilis 8321]|uniref:Uncharacterized protein n=1 Tax=Thioflavicoccus mobilis 8321 TaxID=765912 RepID=L0GXF6_9GAMM|nr:hypothetical protein Thimo_1258 [Thioflavicoccus mobilis 8321]